MRPEAILPVLLVVTGCGAAVTQSGVSVSPSAKTSPGAILSDFTHRVEQYVDLRNKVVEDVGVAEVTEDPARLRAREEALATRIRTLRANAKHGDIFSPAIRMHFRRLLAREVKGPKGRDIRDILDDDAPTAGAVPIEVNGKYPAGVPYASTPAPVLLALPVLPGGLEYRVVGRDLILLDRPADVIVDFIRNAIPRVNT